MSEIPQGIDQETDPSKMIYEIVRGELIRHLNSNANHARVPVWVENTWLDPLGKIDGMVLTLICSPEPQLELDMKHMGLHKKLIPIEARLYASEETMNLIGITPDNERKREV